MSGSYHSFFGMDRPGLRCEMFVLYQRSGKTFGQVGQAVLSSAHRGNATIDTSVDDSVRSPGRRNVLSKKTEKTKKTFATEVLVTVTGPSDTADETSHFCPICRKNDSVQKFGPHKITPNFQDACSSPRDQRLRLETIGYWVLDFEGTYSQMMNSREDSHGSTSEAGSWTNVHRIFVGQPKCCRWI